MRLGLSRQDVARLSENYPTKMSASFLAKVEQGLHSPHATSIVSLSSIYDVPVELLMDHLRLDLWSEEIPDESNAQALHTKGRDYLVRDAIEQARACLSKAAEGYKTLLAVRAEDEVVGRYQELCLDLGITLVRSGLRHAAETYLKRVLEPPQAPEKLRAYALYYLAIVYMDSGTRDLARLAAMSAFETAELLDDEGLALSSRTLLAGVDRASGNFDKARRAQEYCWHQFEALGQATSAAVARASYGYCTVRKAIEDSNMEGISEGLTQQRLALKEKSVSADGPRSCRIRSTYGMSLYEAGKSGLKGASDYLLTARTELARANRQARELKLVHLEFDSRFYLWRVVQELGRKEAPHLGALAKLRPKLPTLSPEAREYDRIMVRRSQKEED